MKTTPGFGTGLAIPNAAPGAYPSLTARADRNVRAANRVRAAMFGRILVPLDGSKLAEQAMTPLLLFDSTRPHSVALQPISLHSAGQSADAHYFHGIARTKSRPGPSVDKCKHAG